MVRPCFNGPCFLRRVEKSNSPFLPRCVTQSTFRRRLRGALLQRIGNHVRDSYALLTLLVYFLFVCVSRDQPRIAFWTLVILLTSPYDKTPWFSRDIPGLHRSALGSRFSFLKEHLALSTIFRRLFFFCLLAVGLCALVVVLQGLKNFYVCCPAESVLINRVSSEVRVPGYLSPPPPSDRLSLMRFCALFRKVGLLFFFEWRFVRSLSFPCCLLLREHFYFSSARLLPSPSYYLLSAPLSFFFFFVPKRIVSRLARLDSGALNG